MLHEALDQRELRLAYQPIVRTSDQKVVAAEALLRWRRKDGTMIPPAEFISIAEESGLMIRIGEYVLEAACQQLSEWQKAGVECPVVCVNVAKIQLMNSDFAPFVAHTLKKYRVDPARIEFEISERGVLSGDFDIVNQLHALKASGVRLSVDDFGTGDSAIAYLKELPIDVLKIDKSYISGVTRNRKDAAITSAMVALAQRLDLLVIAEGVETSAQLEELRKLGCDACQGFLFSPAVQPSAFEKLIEDSPVLDQIAIA
jgi:EAL domain-containing protein (putative c-di-GMP-specific phosphodiesterase class I)